MRGRLAAAPSSFERWTMSPARIARDKAADALAQPFPPIRRPARQPPDRIALAFGDKGEAVDRADPAFQRNVTGFEADEPVASCERGAGGPRVRPGCDHHMMRAGRLDDQIDCLAFLLDDDHGVCHDALGHPGDQGGKRCGEGLGPGAGMDKCAQHHQQI